MLIEIKKDSQFLYNENKKIGFVPTKLDNMR